MKLGVCDLDIFLIEICCFVITDLVVGEKYFMGKMERREFLRLSALAAEEFAAVVDLENQLLN